MTIQFPTTAAEYVALISHPAFAAFMIFMVFRTLNRSKAPKLGKFSLSIVAWSDFSKIVFAGLLSLVWSTFVSVLAKDFQNFSWDLVAFIVARSVGVWGGNQAVYAGLTKFLGPIGTKFLGGGISDPGELIGGALTAPDPDAPVVLQAVPAIELGKG